MSEQQEPHNDENRERPDGAAPKSAASAPEGAFPDEPRPVIPISGVVFGETIYWTTIAAAVIALIGSLMAFLGAPTLKEPYSVLDAVISGHSPAEIWDQLADGVPEGHWYLHHLGTADGIMGLGLALGVFSVVPATLASAWLLHRQGQRLFAFFAFIAALITAVSVVGLIPLPITA